VGVASATLAALHGVPQGAWLTARR
jgi:hypothetical protein